MTQSQILKNNKNSITTANALQSLKLSLGISAGGNKVNDNADSNNNKVADAGKIDEERKMMMML